jgi:hypothetical protein
MITLNRYKSKAHIMATKEELNTKEERIYELSHEVHHLRLIIKGYQEDAHKKRQIIKKNCDTIDRLNNDRILNINIIEELEEKLEKIE